MIAGYKLINPHTKQPTGFVEKIENGTKIHTIRRGDRWSKAFAKAQAEGRDLLIQHSTGVRTKHFKNFQTNKVKSVQKVEIRIFAFTTVVLIEGKESHCFSHVNDGFETKADFDDWFIADIQKNGPFIGEIIHWTDLKY